MSRLLKVLVMCGILASGAYWAAHVGFVWQRDSYRAAAAGASYAVLLSGARLEIQDWKHVQHLKGIISQRPRTLLLVVSDYCPVTASVMPKWRELLEVAARLPDVTVIVLTVAGTKRADELASVIEQRGGQYAVFSTANNIRLNLDSGINRAPLTLVLDEHSRIRAVVDGAEIRNRREVADLVTSCVREGC